MPGDVTNTAAHSIVAVDPKWKGLYRIGGISMITAGPVFIILAAFAIALAPSLASTDAALKNLASQATLLQGDIGFAILSDLLVIPAALALYFALKGLNKNAMTVAAGLLGLFVILDLGLSLPNFLQLTTISQNYLAATSDAQRSTYVASMNNLFSLLSLVSPICAFMVPSIGSLIASLVMHRGIFTRHVAYVGVFASAAGILVGLSILLPPLANLDLIYLPLFGIWFMLVGFRLYGLGKELPSIDKQSDLKT